GVHLKFSGHYRGINELEKVGLSGRLHFRKNHNRWMFINWIINFLIILTFAVFILIDLFYKR
ncbi:hypothetical protein, partial [Acinetobacter indicus]|uniref:hypothetical protein n=1 Tax=Acinetobacter indicus TaxID=756892 RepID=UPI001C0A3CEA